MLDDEEVACVLNTHGTDRRGADVVVATELNPPGSALTVVLNTAQPAQGVAPSFHTVGSTLPVKRKADGTAFIEIRDVAAIDTRRRSPDTGIRRGADGDIGELEVESIVRSRRRRGSPLQT